MTKENRSLEQVILDLQWQQQQHDERFHKDILLLRVGDRVKHYALHFAKYVGSLADLEQMADPRASDKVIVDTFIIDVAFANSLNLRLSETYVDVRLPSPCTLVELGKEFANRFGFRNPGSVEFKSLFARYTGKLAKACESLDHVEQYPFRETMRDCALSIFRIAAAEASIRGIELASIVRVRQLEVEKKSIFHTQLSENSSK